MKKIKLLFLFLFTSLSIFLLNDIIFAQTAYNVRVTEIRFLYGVGKGPTQSPPNYLPVNYYRGYDLPGTLIEITAEMDVEGVWRPLYGDVKFEITYASGANNGTFEVTVHSGQNKGTGQIPYNNATGFLDTWITTGSTQEWTYTATGATGDYAAVLTSVSQSVYWDRADEPHDATFPPANASQVLVSTTTNSIRLEWLPLNTSTDVPNTLYNEDFYEYRVHYKKSTDTVWRMWNGSNDPTLRGLDNNPAIPPADDTAMHFSGGRKFTTIPNLEILTSYDYYITAVDVFGNESSLPATPFNALTQPYSVKVAISDGITTYQDFTDLTNPGSRSMREANIKVEMYVVAANTPPDAMRVWFTYDAVSPDIITSSNTVNTGGFAPDTLFYVDAVKTAPNVWTAYMSTHTPVIKSGNNVRFILESNIGGVPTFSDYDLSDQNPNDDEWTFSINTQAKLTPGPVRILNNVITNRHPLAYPSYYLSEDAFVTITVYDIKGRAVAKIMDRAFRRGGLNIKEDGWPGTNKANRKLGVGLYYIFIKAERASDNKLLLNESRKVVIAK